MKKNRKVLFAGIALVVILVLAIVFIVVTINNQIKKPNRNNDNIGKILETEEEW